MSKDVALLDKIYFWPEYSAVARAVGYAGMTYIQLTQVIEDLATQFPKAKVESAIYHLTTFEGQMTVHPPPLAQVKFREHVKPLLWQLLGPSPEQEDAFYRHPDGSPRERPNKEEPPPSPPPPQPGRHRPAPATASPPSDRWCASMWTLPPPSFHTSTPPGLTNFIAEPLAAPRSASGTGEVFVPPPAPYSEGRSVFG